MWEGRAHAKLGHGVEALIPRPSPLPGAARPLLGST